MTFGGMGVEDVKRMFQDFDIIVLREDRENFGIFLKAKKPKIYFPTDLSHLTLYSMILGRRTASIPKMTDMPLSRRLKLSINEAMKIVIGKFSSFFRVC